MVFEVLKLVVTIVVVVVVVVLVVVVIFEVLVVVVVAVAAAAYEKVKGLEVIASSIGSCFSYHTVSAKDTRLPTRHQPTWQSNVSIINLNNTLVVHSAYLSFIIILKKQTCKRISGL